MRSASAAFGIILALAWTGGTATRAEAQMSTAQPNGIPADTPGPAEKPSIGQASMMEDGSIVLRLRAEAEGAVGDAQFVYKPNDPDYRSILDHVGGLTPGEHKPVPPWR